MDEEEKRRMAMEYRADVRATKAPMRHVGDQGATEYVSKVAARKVIEDAVRAGETDAVIDAMKKRMRKWYGIVMKYKTEMDEVRRDGKMKDDEKTILLEAMERNLEACYDDMYGGVSDAR